MSDEEKAAAGIRAAELVRPGMLVGLGTGTTVHYFLEALQGVDFVGVPTSEETARIAQRRGVRLTDEPDRPLDLAIDGADEIDPEFNLIKGRGGALLREKLVALLARRFVVIAEESKLVRTLGLGVLLPVEVVPFLWRQTARRLEGLGAAWELRGGDARPFQTDNGNLILDLEVAGGVVEPGRYARALKETAGVCEHGLFVGMASGVIVAGPQGVRELGSVR